GDGPAPARRAGRGGPASRDDAQPEPGAGRGHPAAGETERDARAVRGAVPGQGRRQARQGPAAGPVAYSAATGTASAPSWFAGSSISRRALSSSAVGT